MSSFRPGPAPAGVQVARPAWPSLDTHPHEPDLPGAESMAAETELPHPDPQVDAARVLEEAHLQAVQILQMAASEAELALAEARRQGFEAGRAEGIAAAEAELEQMRQRVRADVEQAAVQADLILQAARADAKASRAEAEAQSRTLIGQAKDEAGALLSDARAKQHQMLDDAQAALVDLAVTAAMRLVHGHLALRPASVVNMVAAGLRRLKDTNCTVRVSLQDLPLLEAQRSTLERELGVGILQIQPDTGLSQGSYLVASPQGQIDAQLDHQAAQISTALAVALGGPSE